MLLACCSARLTKTSIRRFFEKSLKTREIRLTAGHVMTAAANDVDKLVGCEPFYKSSFEFFKSIVPPFEKNIFPFEAPCAII